MEEKLSAPKEYKAKTVPAGPFKLKDRQGKNGILLNLEKLFGFSPEQIIIQKVSGENNKFLVLAIKKGEDTAKVFIPKETIFVPEHIAKEKNG